MAYNLYVQISFGNEGFCGVWLGLKVDEDVTFSTCPHLKYKGNFFFKYVALLFNQTPVHKIHRHIVFMGPLSSPRQCKLQPFLDNQTFITSQ